MKTKALTKLAYEAPETSVDVIEMEQCFLQGTTVRTQQLQDWNDPNVIYDEDF